MSEYSSFDDLRTDIKSRMDKTIDMLKQEFAGIRAGRASGALLDGITVEAYGAMSPISQVGTISTPDARLITVQIWDKGLVKAVEKAIQSSDLGLNPMSDGQLIRIPMPPLSEERRKELVKVASRFAENSKIAIRNIRRDGMDSLKRMESEGHISEDEQKRHEDEIQKFTDSSVKQIEELLSHKEKDILQV